MKQDSRLFDRIRVKPSEDRRLRPGARRCEAPNCRNEGEHRAPMGRGREGQFFWFCIEHVREYNATYNYFNGMDDNELSAYQKDALTGHRPTWTMAVNAWGRAAGRADPARGGPLPHGAQDAFNLFEGAEWKKAQRPEAEPEGRMIRNAERKAFTTLGLDISATDVEIKARFKDLAKRHHPDSNGGDRSREDKLREIIQAYNYLKKAGFC